MEQLRYAIPLIVVFAAVLITAVIDLWKFKIHNVITLPLLISGVAYHGYLDYHLGGDTFIGQSLLGAFSGIAVLGVFYCMGGVGAGDVKLLGSIGAWLGCDMLLFVFLASALACGVYAVIVIVTCGRFKETWVNLKIIYYRLMAVGKHLGAEDHVEVALTKDDRRTRVIPFAAMVAVGMLALLGFAWCVGNP